MKVMVDEKEYNYKSVKNISTRVVGNNITQTIINGDVVHSSSSGCTVNISVYGDVYGNVENLSGMIKCANVGRNVTNVSGRIECNHIEGKVETVSGRVSANIIKGSVDTVSGSVKIR